MSIRVLLADDDEAIRSAYGIILDAQPDIEVVGEAADGVAAVEAAHRLRPDVILADIRMPRMDGLELTRQLSEEFRVVVVTTFDLDEYVHTAIRSGAAGFLLKRSGPTLLAEAVRAAVAGDALISPQITVRLLRELSGRALGEGPELQQRLNPGSEQGRDQNEDRRQEQKRSLQAERRRDGGDEGRAGRSRRAEQSRIGWPRPLFVEELTARETEVAQLVADGATNAEIGSQLFITAGTVKNHLAAVQRKIGARNRVGIAAWVWETGA
ncbi:response regulator transcription factor [Kitasatospora sp. CM 4170]|uniref:Response regulator n=1 Tax=Kitasatospora aburaviensis TaxID=67265 RepID=A0ABW1F3B4_9ACTN|nr:response regulator transcription factor [Kitasatospora sp. CM 4170]WNM47300.1 response regulator transcription factor [Kitasatospora sp. CM 4170]